MLHDGCMRDKKYLSTINKVFDDIEIQCNGFHLKSLVKSTGADTVMTVYIEGDGQAWKNRYTVSTDPTPQNSIPLQLATVDPASKVAYIARPCQYSGINDLKCKQSTIYWTTHRYGNEIVETMNLALNELKKKTKTDTLKLIGFSGGGTLAVLLAARRNDIIKIITIAANLDHTLWTDMHQVTPLYASMNAADFAEDVQLIPQVHFVGGNDQIVNKQVVQSFRDRMTNHSFIKIITVDDYTHKCCWVKKWLDLLKK